MTISSDLHSAAKFVADHPELNVEGVVTIQFDIAPGWESSCGPAQLVAFLDGLDDLPITATFGGRTNLRRDFGNLRAYASVPTELLAETPPAPSPSYLTVGQIRDRASTTQLDLGGDAA